MQNYVFTRMLGALSGTVPRGLDLPMQVPVADRAPVEAVAGARGSQTTPRLPLGTTTPFHECKGQIVCGCWLAAGGRGSQRGCWVARRLRMD